MKLRDFSNDDWPQVWKILEPVFRAGETYAISTSITEEECSDLWVEKPCRTFAVALDGDEIFKGGNTKEESIVGTYYLKPNQSVGSNGSHVCNCGYVVASQARGKGLAGKMCEHSLEIALEEEDFLAMQHNFVVATNAIAIKIRQKYGFQIVGTMPLSFRHPGLGCFVDAHVMYKFLKPRQEIVNMLPNKN